MLEEDENCGVAKKIVLNLSIIPFCILLPIAGLFLLQLSE